MKIIHTKLICTRTITLEIRIFFVLSEELKHPILGLCITYGGEDPGNTRWVCHPHISTPLRAYLLTVSIRINFNNAHDENHLY